MEIIVNEAMATRRVDDSDEGEATALDLRPSSRSARVPADGPSQPRAPAPPKSPTPAPASRRPILADSSEDDEDATEFLSVRPPSRGPARLPSTEAVPRAQGRAVPIEASSPPPAPPGQAAPPSPLPLPPSPSPLPAAIASPLPPSATDTIRPLPHRTIASDASATGTASVPRVTRIHIVARQSTTNGDQDEVPESTADIDPETTIPPQVLVKAPPPRVPTKVESRDDETQAGEDPDETQAPSQQAPPEPPAPPHRRLPTSAEGDALPARRSPARPSEVHDGVLVVDAPPEATVTVNGIERGRGTVRVGDLDREARHAVRIHCAGFAPWSGSVSLQGKPAAKIRPALKPRAR